MKSFGLVRSLDKMGRIVIPQEIFLTRDIYVNDLLNFRLDGHRIIVTKVSDKCEICRTTDSLSNFKDKKICERCMNHIKKTL